MTASGYRPRRRLVALISGAVLALGSTGARAQQLSPPATFRLTPWTDLGLQPVRVAVPPQFSHLPDTLSVNLPPGFRARVYAAFADLNRPRFMAFSPGGVLYVADMDDGEVVALPDLDGDGVADTSRVVASGFSRPHSLAFYKGDLFVGDRPQIVRLRDGDGDGLFEEREVFVDGIPSSGQHSTRTLVIDEAGGRMYLGVGWPCDLCRNSESERGTILQFNLDGSGRRVFASGVRNVVGLAIHPVTGQLWGTNNGHDLEGIDSPPEWVDIIRDGSFHGMPLAFGDRVWADFTIPAYRDRILPLTHSDSLLVETMEPPAALLPAHTAPMGIHFYTHDQFPAAYRNAAFIALHAGHAKLAAIEGYSVVALFSDPDGSHARFADFMTGLQTGTEVEDVWGFPMGLATDAAGNLYVSSDLAHHLILRVEHGPLVASWRDAPPDTVQAGAPLALATTVRVERLAAGAGDPEVRADLSAIGGPADLPLVPAGDGLFRLELRLFVPTDQPRGLKTVSVTVRQTAVPRDHVERLTATVALLPARALEDLVIYDEGLAPGWTAVHKTWTEGLRLDLADEQFAFRGEVSASFRGVSGDWNWASRFRPPQPVDPVGYDRLHFAFHPGLLDRRGEAELDVYLAGALLNLTREGLVDMNRKEWQVVDIPLRRFGAAPIKEITFGGGFNLYYYLDDLRLVATSPVTAVVDDGPAAPDGFALEPNYPNPFNRGTVIPFSLPREQEVALTVYDLAGQRVAIVVAARLGAGRHALRWEGRDDGGAVLASGVYFYRLRAGDRLVTRKLLLVR